MTASCGQLMSNVELRVCAQEGTMTRGFLSDVHAVGDSKRNPRDYNCNYGLWMTCKFIPLNFETDWC